MINLFSISESLWLLIGICFMLIFSIYLSFLYFSNNENPFNFTTDNEVHNKNKTNDKLAKFLALIVVFLALISYSFMFLSTNYFSHKEVTIIRYFEWMITTPLLLIDLALKAKLPKKSIQTIIILDVFMIALGFAAVSVNQKIVKYIFFFLSTLCMIYIFYILLSKNYNQNENKKHESLIANIYTIILWLIYPIIWILGHYSTKTLSISSETLSYTILDTLAKPVFASLFVF